ncbi:alpha/beta hydrolase [Virgisporangium aliadipatigenens]|uniref:Alpha/beta hydrolase n=1 Tax=Virgisporangium aliadipatigenens TaxID=741659 RepID=A0A8J4DQR4_9ACTN|nr:alpha/beta fold hydrolase [Virgisporangium aliadipatigenens]GIJ46003.1 alpha/beta hydrolase [Virgisporangium aliadipatigenens]
MSKLSRLRSTVAIAVVAALVPATPVRAQPPQSIRWGPCADVTDTRTECADLSVPRDYRAMGGAHLTVAVSRVKAADPRKRRGILLVNPGGPGGSGIELAAHLADALPAEVRERYDLIGFDPRGVGRSTPISCGIPEDTPPDLYLPYPAPDGSIDRNIAFARDTARRCAESVGDLLPHITTANTARDMDRIRAALGEPKLSYLGYSYGTYLGAVYASLFPQRTDRIVLDSAVDPTSVWYGLIRSKSEAFALRLPDFTKWAAARDDVYHLGATPDAVERTYYRIAEQLDRAPVAFPELTVNGNIFRQLNLRTLEHDRAFGDLAEFWHVLSDPAAPPATRSAATVPLAAPAPDNVTSVLYAVVCGDVSWPRGIGLYARNSAADRRAYPGLAGMPGNIWPCAFWAQPVEPPVAVTGRGPRNVLILQNLRDPSTSWRNGYGLRRALGDRAAFVSVDAGGHGIYALRSGPCTDAVTTGFLVGGVLPAQDRFCRGPSPEEVSTFAERPRLWTL